MKPKFIGITLNENKKVEGHLFYFDDGRMFISPTGESVVGDETNEPNKYLARFNVFEVVPESVKLFSGEDAESEMLTLQYKFITDLEKILDRRIVLQQEDILESVILAMATYKKEEDLVLDRYMNEVE